MVVSQGIMLPISWGKPWASLGNRAGALRVSGPLIKRRIDAGTDRGETAGSSPGAGSYAEGGGGACQSIPLDPVLPGVRQARSLHADRDEDRQGIRGALRGVGGGVVASRTIPTLAPISRFPGATLCANFACIGFSEVRLTIIFSEVDIRDAA